MVLDPTDSRATTSSSVVPGEMLAWKLLIYPRRRLSGFGDLSLKLTWCCCYVICNNLKLKYFKLHRLGVLIIMAFKKQNRPGHTTSKIRKISFLSHWQTNFRSQTFEGGLTCISQRAGSHSCLSIVLEQWIVLCRFRTSCPVRMRNLFAAMFRFNTLT
jgi:hypothetical protein